MRRMGCNRSHPDKIAAAPKLGAHPKLAGALAPSAASLQAAEPPREDQGDSEGCTGHSASIGIWIFFAHMGLQLPCVPSPKILYGVGRALERFDLSKALTDTGANLADVLVGAATYGISPMHAPAPDGRNSDVTDSNVNDEPDFVTLEEGALALVGGAYSIDVGDLDTMASAIAAGFPLYIGFFCDAGFQNWKNGDAPYGAPNTSDSNGGGHAVVIDGYSTNADGSRTWRLVNSWGTSWGDAGAARVSDAFMNKVWEIWALDLALSEVA